jgi:L-lactate dehydrogenase complex protein LldG
VSDATSARDAMLAAVRAALPPAVERPEPLWRNTTETTDDVPRSDAFTAAAVAAGATVTLGAPGDVSRLVGGAIGDARAVLSFVQGVTSTFDAGDDLRALNTLDVLVCESSLGVAENGAVWIASGDPVLRAALFLAASVVIVVAEEQLVDDLHQAYERLDVSAHPYGVFIAGPSKTADIEQSLVIGAHGPKELTLVLVRTTDVSITQSDEHR